VVSDAGVWHRLLVGVVLSAGIGALAYRRGSLSRSGVAGAIGIGTCIFGLGGWVWGVLLVAFFVSSSLLGHVGGAAKSAVAAAYAKGGRRDLWQVLANGGLSALLAVAVWLWPVPLLWGGYVGAIAAVTADTWATELGVLARRPPRLITTWRRAPPGTSGAVSLLGTAAAVSGAIAIGVLALALTALDAALTGAGSASFGRGGVLGVASLPLCAAAGGLAGAAVDSVLGATVQGMYRSARRGRVTERRADPDGTPNEPVSGWRWVTNDVVNLVSSAAGALVGAVVLALLRPVGAG
jgi:uncharacterized protein (TIGR00297 family)